ncbi:hypothetical protein B484DRAFT_460008 [Ochromonadaceae sp. CCMP2298]|nr:hypothetical protein B484DRAFT_460008 [Ochromonadaceae sp. CCMP2298]|mmetsp:Transcript_22786/g.50673  ORF Transcript_22786/g.50673 Transcript_22786/m.50673 type:complete len:158 (-) Transcript_22786:126-599(-)
MVIHICHDDAEASRDISKLLQESMPDTECTLEVLQKTIDQQLATQEGNVSNVYVFVIQSAADGTVNRGVRNFVKSVDDNAVGIAEFGFFILALGGARCVNSAAATAVEVYSSARKLKSKLEKAGARTKLVELNVELEDIGEAVTHFAETIKAITATL